MSVRAVLCICACVHAGMSLFACARVCIMCELEVSNFLPCRLCVSPSATLRVPLGIFVCEPREIVGRGERQM